LAVASALQLTICVLRLM